MAGFATGIRRQDGDDPAAKPVTVQDLVALWTGDEFSDGYQTPELAAAIARRLKPRNFPELGEAIRPGWPEFVHVDEVKMLERGWRVYLREKADGR